jgi:hypothetical protein
MAKAPIEDRNTLLACYAVYLILGNTIRSLRIKHATLRGYMTAAIGLFLLRDLPDPTEPTFLREADQVGPLLKAVKAFETVKNRKEMITDSMVSTMLKSTLLSAPTSLEASLLDWILLGRFTGFRRSEWCQDGPGIEMTEPSVAQDVPQPRAFLADDFIFYDAAGQRIYNLSADHEHIVDCVKIRWRFQKNKDNGQIIPYKRDHKRPQVCPVLAAYRIIRRASALGIPPHVPVAAYASTSSPGGYSLIRASHVVKFIRRAAQVTFNLKATDSALKAWTCHSIRVTAANILHRANMSDSYIQTRLRWKSNTFLMYLRNTFYSADQHTKAMDISNANLPLLPTSDGKRYRPLEPHEQVYSAQLAVAATA